MGKTNVQSSAMHASPGNLLCGSGLHPSPGSFARSDVTTDELLGLKPPPKPRKTQDDGETRRIWKKFQLMMSLPEKDRRAVIRLVNSLVGSTHIKKAS